VRIQGRWHNFLALPPAEAERGVAVMHLADNASPLVCHRFALILRFIAQRRTGSLRTEPRPKDQRLTKLMPKGLPQNVVGRCRIGRSGEALATVDMAALRVRAEFARSHIFDHTLTQRADSVSLAHGELLPE
jgi:hypothetical protein